MEHTTLISCNWTRGWEIFAGFDLSKIFLWSCGLDLRYSFEGNILDTHYTLLSGQSFSYNWIPVIVWISNGPGILCLERGWNVGYNIHGESSTVSSAAACAAARWGLVGSDRSLGESPGGVYPSPGSGFPLISGYHDMSSSPPPDPSCTLLPWSPLILDWNPEPK